MQPQNRTRYIQDRALVLKQLEEQDSFISKARKLFVANKLKFDDFSGLKLEYQTSSGILRKEFKTVMTKLKCLDEQIRLARKSLGNVLQGYQYMDAGDKKQIVGLISPAEIDTQTSGVSLQLNSAIAKILYSNT